MFGLVMSNRDAALQRPGRKLYGKAGAFKPCDPGSSCRESLLPDSQSGKKRLNIFFGNC